LLGGGLLLSLARPLPFLVAAVVLVAAIAGFTVLLSRTGIPTQYGKGESTRQVTARLWRWYALILYGRGYLALVFTTSRPLIAAAIPFVAIGGGTVMTLAYAVLMPLMPEDEHGALTGFYSLSRGIGIVTGPILAGILISVTEHGPLASTQGFQAMWIVCAAATFASLPFLGRMRRERSAAKVTGAGARIGVQEL
jgi:MFS transporter